MDNTNVLAAERAVYIERARAARFRVIGYYFPPELRAAIKRNSIRKDKRPIPVPGVIGTYKRLQPPTPAEGFDELYEVRVDPENRFVVTPWQRAADQGST